MKLIEVVKKEFEGCKKLELAGLLIVILFIFYNAIFLKDNIFAVCNAIFGILYTFMAGKGRISCYFFGLLGSGCYIFLSYKNMLWGQTLLYLCYYVPMQITGIFRWKKHLKKDSSEIIKTKLNKKEQLKFLLLAIFGSFITIIVLYLLNDKCPIIDGITTFLSILGMYFTVRRYIEQWFCWMFVNGLSVLMWLKIILSGTKAYSTLVMWLVYFVLAFYFYLTWKKECDRNNVH